MQRQSSNLCIRKIEYVFYHEKSISDAVLEARNEPGGHTGGNAGHAFVSDPTAIKAIKNAEELKVITIDGDHKVSYPERWLRVCAAVREDSNTDAIKREIFRRRYGGEPYQRTCADVCIGETTYWMNLKEIRSYALACACQEGLVKVF